MSENTKIEWADHSWSPWRGCTKVSPGCAHCYAETLSKRNPAVLGDWGQGKPRVLAKNWGDPMRWNRREETLKVRHSEFSAPERPRVFPSLCDWLDDEVPIGWLAQFLKLIHDTPNLDWLLLTKRPENWEDRTLKVCQLWNTNNATEAVLCHWLTAWRRSMEIPKNVWFGVSVENQKLANERIRELLKIPAVLRWLSVEPLLGPIELSGIAIENDAIGHSEGPLMTFQKGLVDWVVIGGESGNGARPCNVEWIRALVKQCQGVSVPVFVKQLGANSYVRAPFGPLTHPKGGDPSEWPTDLRVREFPEAT